MDFLLKSGPIYAGRKHRNGLALWSPEIWISGNPDFRKSGYPETQISGYPDIRKSGYPEIRISEYPDIWISGYPETRISGNPDIRISGFPDIRVSVNPDFRKSGFPGSIRPAHFDFFVQRKWVQISIGNPLEVKTDAANCTCPTFAFLHFEAQEV